MPYRRARAVSSSPLTRWAMLGQSSRSRERGDCDANRRDDDDHGEDPEQDARLRSHAHRRAHGRRHERGNEDDSREWRVELRGGGPAEERGDPGGEADAEARTGGLARMA